MLDLFHTHYFVWNHVWFGLFKAENLEEYESLAKENGFTLDGYCMFRVIGQEIPMTNHELFMALVSIDRAVLDWALGKQAENAEV
jgi:hypothetical protein